MATELFDLLQRLSLASGAATLAVLLLRRPLRAMLGAQLAYAAWLAVPACMLAAALPSLRVTQEVLVDLMPAPQIAAAAAPLLRPESPDWTALLLALWLAGAGVLAAMFIHAQRRYVATLGRLSERGGLWFASVPDAGPALLGMLRTRIVVPSDFTTRYEPMEQALIVAHEERHALRGDPFANALAALLQCVFWFNPLMHVAAGRFRFDQELACDAAVMERQPGRTQAYAAAMLKTQDTSAPALAACHWQSSHPLKERIMNLKKPAPAAGRRMAGRLILAGLLSVSAMGAVMARADIAQRGPLYDVALRLEIGGKVETPRVHVREGEHFLIRSEQAEGVIEGDFVINSAGKGQVSVQMKLSDKAGIVGEPRMIMLLGESSSIKVSGKNGKGDYKVTLTVLTIDKRGPVR